VQFGLFNPVRQKKLSHGINDLILQLARIVVRPKYEHLKSLNKVRRK